MTYTYIKLSFIKIQLEIDGILPLLPSYTKSPETI